MAERYSRALESSHLEVDVEHPGDVDVLIASGWVGPSLGSDLLRTRSEYDSVNKRELACAAESLVSRVVVLSSLSSLDATKRHVAGFAIQMATITKFDREPEEVLRIAAKALDDGIEQERVQHAAMDRDLRPLVTGIQSARLAPDQLAVLVVVAQ